MKVSISFLLFLVLYVPSGDAFAAEKPGISAMQEPSVTAFTNVNVIPMDEDRVLMQMTILVRGDRIYRIGTAGEVEIPSGAEIIDGEGQYLIPGLAEMHGHVPPVTPAGGIPERYLEDVLFLYIAGGVTTVRGMLGHPNQLELRDRVHKGELIGPNLYLAGPSFSGNTINSPQEATERVWQQKEEGWDLLKVHPGLSLEEFEAMAQAAHEAGMDFAGHIPADVGLENAIRLGIKTIDHLDGYINYMDALEQPVSEDRLQQAVRLTLDHDVWVVPTQALWETLIGAADHEKLLAYDELRYMPVSVRDSWKTNLARRTGSEHASLHAQNRQKLLKALHDGDVKILMGTDAPQIFSVPGFSLRHELAIMEEAGMTPFEILLTGTRNIGEYFSDKDDFGTITEGSRADLILLPENPLENLSVIERHNGVMIRGRWLPRREIDQKLEEIEQAYKN